MHSERMARDVLALLDALEIAKVDIVGHSMGGYVGMVMAHLAPAKVSTVVTFGTKFYWDHATIAKTAGELDPASLRAKSARYYEALASVNRATPEQPAQGYDGWLVAFFDEINQDMWNRQPGDRLTFRQKFDMSGQIFTALLGLTLFVSVVIYMAMNIDEWEFGRKR